MSSRSFRIWALVVRTLLSLNVGVFGASVRLCPWESNKGVCEGGNLIHKTPFARYMEQNSNFFFSFRGLDAADMLEVGVGYLPSGALHAYAATIMDTTHAIISRCRCASCIALRVAKLRTCDSRRFVCAFWVTTVVARRTFYTTD